MMQPQGRSAEQAWASQIIRSARARLGFDVHWAAGLLGVSAGHLFEVECGMVPPSVGLCRRVVTALNVPADEATELLAAVGVVGEEVRAWQNV